MTTDINITDLSLSGIEIPFGKYRGTPLSDLDDGYLHWMAKWQPDSGWVSEWMDENRSIIIEILRQRSISKIRDMPEVTLSESQQAAVDAIDEHLLKASDNHVMRLQGGAGYGKSFATNAVVINAIRQGYQVRGCATSYVATQVLRQQLDPLGVECGTIASTIRLQPNYEGSKETYEITPDTYDVLPELLARGHLLIVDEYSMVEDTIGKMFVDYANACGGKLLVVGDANQLPSPAQDWPSMLDQVEPSAALTTPMRYAEESTLYQVEKIVRSNPYGFRASDFANGNGEVSVYSGWDDFMSRFVETYRANPQLDVRMLWYRRQHMVDANHAIREALYGKTDELVCADEQIRVQRTTDIPTKGAGIQDTLRYYSGTHYRVQESTPHIERVTIGDHTYSIPCVRAQLSNGHSANLLFSVTEGKADENCLGGKEFNVALADIADRCHENEFGWKEYRHFRNTFLQVAYSYATTVHRTQGMSADIVFVSPAALKQAPVFQAKRLLYVGLTRAKKELHCLGD